MMTKKEFVGILNKIRYSIVDANLIPNTTA